MTNHIFLDGTACLGKSSLVSRMRSFVKSDLCERVKAHDIFRHKATNINLQILYTAVFPFRTDAQVYDRSPITDIWYNFVADEMKGEEWFSKLQQLPKKLLQQFPSVFIICSEDQASQVVAKMKQRQNGLDILEETYVSAQNAVFSRVAKYLDMPLISVAALTLYSDRYTEKLIALLFPFIDPDWLQQESFDQSSLVVFSNANLSKETDDAGYDMSIKKTTMCEKGKPTMLELNELVLIPSGYYGFLVARSSTNKLGTIRPGIIDAGYSGTIAAVFVSDETIFLQKNYKLCQLIIQPHAADATICSVSKTQFATEAAKYPRGKQGYGSTGCAKIPWEEFSAKWQRQPCTSQELTEYRKEEKNILFLEFEN